tara:strand:+ start:886 stop:1422 length:537 start_codon:yes stop_codon:yes gene_type:complete
MAIKKIAFDTVHKLACGIVFDTEAEALKHLPDGDGGHETAGPEWKIFDVDYDPSVDYISSYELNAAGTALVNPVAGKTIAEQTKYCEDRYTNSVVEKEKHVKKHQVKIWAGVYIDELAWKINRAKDIDAINGNSDALRAVYQERQDVRDKSNAAEAAIDALTTETAVREYDPKSWINS